MEKYSKIGLPALIGALVLFVFAVKTFVNIGYGEAGVLFKTFGNGVVTQSININIVPKSLMYDEIKNPYKIEKIIEATAPSTVFFGDRDLNSFVFPKLTPIKYPTVSIPHIKNKYAKITFLTSTKSKHIIE